jgi:predicted alpha/beta-fold hydrolase
MVAPPLLAMAELWLRLFAGAIAPLGTFYLILWNMNMVGTFSITQPSKGNNSSTPSQSKLSTIVVLTVASSAVVMTDTLYVLENGPLYGALLFLSATLVALQTCLRHQLSRAATIILTLVMLFGCLVWDFENQQVVFGNKIDQVHIQEGLYYDNSNPFVSKIMQNWPESYRIYDKEHGASRWMPTGDSRTGIPFLINSLPNPEWKRFFLEVDEKEYVALDISFPPGGHDKEKPVYLVLHGLNGGSDEEYVRDLTLRRNAENSTVVVMVARGLMDLPVKGWNCFHGARTSDAHAAALAVKRAIQGNHQILIGAGYSMGAIILSNYVASYGEECALDGAVSISGGLDMRYQEHFFRAQRLWQPMLTETLRDDFLLGKWGHRVKEKLTHDEFLRMLRASHVTEVDRYAVVPLNGFDDLDHYYRSMSALGDIPHDSNGRMPMQNNGKVHNVHIPLVVVHAFDDPLITWRSTCQNTGFMHPENLVKTGKGNLILLLTRGGGHVGWPLGLIPSVEKWKWMSDVVMSFAEALSEASA